MQSIFLTRHGQRIDKVNKHWKSLPNCPGSLHLSPHGIEQAKALGRRLRDQGVRHIFASPFYRTIETAHHVAEQLDLPIRIEYGICEFLQPRYFPNGFVPRTAEEMAPIFPRIDKSYRTLTHPQAPEDEHRLLERTGRAIDALLNKFGESMLIVSHGTVVRYMCARPLDGVMPSRRTSIECAVTQLSRRDDRWELIHDGDDAHLPPDPSEAADQVTAHR